MGCTPSVSKNPGVTRKPATCSGMSTPDRFGSHHSTADSPVAVVIDWRQSRRSAAAHRLAVEVRLLADGVGGDDDQPIDVGEAQRPQVEGVGEIEDHGVGGQGQRQRADDAGGERRPLPQRPPGVPQLARPARPERRRALDVGHGQPPPRRGQRRHDPAGGEARGERHRLATGTSGARRRHRGWRRGWRTPRAGRRSRRRASRRRARVARSSRSAQSGGITGECADDVMAAPERLRGLARGWPTTRASP